MTICELRQEMRERLQISGVPDPEISADAILEQILQAKPGSLPLFLMDEFPVSQLDDLENLVCRREKREPLQYILSQWGFFELDLQVGPGALIPRPETEDWLGEFILILKKQIWPCAWQFVDVGTGTGAIGLKLARQFPETQGLLIDVSPEALAVATRNLQSYPAEARRLNICQGDLLTPCSKRSVHLVISNPPYIDPDDFPSLMPEVRDFEPHQALNGGYRGIEVISRLLNDASRVLIPGGLLGIEHGHGQRQAICSLPAPGLTLSRTIDDAGGRERAIIWKAF